MEPEGSDLPFSQEPVTIGLYLSQMNPTHPPHTVSFRCI